MKISLVLPVYNEQVILQEVLAKYISDLKAVCSDSKDKYEIIAVNDGCTDGSVDILMGAAKLNRSIRIVNLAGRYGKQAAITAGMAVSAEDSDAVILADVDILNPIGILVRVVDEFKKGAPIVHAKRENFGFDRIKAACSDKFVNLGAKVFAVEGRYTGKSNIALYSRDVADVIKEFPNKNKYLRSMDTWTGWEIKKINYASGYNKVEQKRKMAESYARIKRTGKEVAPRDKAREHTPSAIYALACCIMAIIALCVAISLIFFVLPIYLCLLAWIVFVILLMMSLMFYARAVLVKRVGIIHNKLTAKIYEIKNIVN